MGDLLGGSLQRRRWIVLTRSYQYRFSPVHLEKMDFMRWIVWGNCIATGCMGRTERMGRGWDVGEMEGPILAGAVTGVPPLALEERWAAGSGG